MVLQAIREHQIDLRRSFFIGDKEIDVECGRNAGVRTIRVQTGFDADVSSSAADWTAKDLPAAAQLILDQQSS
jgi:histidinol phosphatase-like enzyme